MGNIRVWVSALFLYIGFQQIMSDSSALSGWLILLFAIAVILCSLLSLRRRYQDQQCGRALRDRGRRSSRTDSNRANTSSSNTLSSGDFPSDSNANAGASGDSGGGCGGGD